MKNILITGANRGIGLALCKQYVDSGAQVYATCRAPSDELAASGATIIENVDVTSAESVASMAGRLDGIELDLVLSNAGLLTRETLDDLDFDRIQQQFEVNTLGPLRVVHSVLNHLSNGSRIGIVTSRVGSIDDNGSGGIYGYRISKAAANMVGKNLANDLHSRGIAVMLLHPGLVATEMTGGNGIEPISAASGLIRQLDQLTLENSGSFWHAEGYQLPW